MPSYRTLSSSFALAISLLGCSGSSQDELSGKDDAGRGLGSGDAGADDGMDASIPDVMVPDGRDGGLDASSPNDAATSDPADASAGDAGQGAGDASTPPTGDAGTPDAGPVDPCVEANCDPVATCVREGVGAFCVCPDGYEGDGQTCTDVATALDGERLDLACTAAASDARECVTGGATSRVITLAGAADARYDVAVRVRGVVELKSYTGGTVSLDYPTLYFGGTPASDDWNVHSIQVSSPAQTIHLNHGTSGAYVCTTVDYNLKLRVDAGATVTLTANPVDTGNLQVKNRDADGEPLIINALDDTAFDGQYFHVDVTSVDLVP